MACIWIQKLLLIDSSFTYTVMSKGTVREKMKKGKFVEVCLGVYYVCLIFITSWITVSQLKMIRQYQVADAVRHCKMDYDSFRMLEVNPRLIGEVATSTHKDCSAYIAYEMLANQYKMDTSNRMRKDQEVFLQIPRVENTECYEELCYYYDTLFKDLEYFPVPLQKAGIDKVDYVNSWGAARNFGGDRLHEGCDLMASKNQRGYYPIISVSDGVVENLGWLPLGGYRIGIRAPHGAYFYYAHLHEYAHDLKVGDEVFAGQLLGFMGDSGYGEEGTMGKFPVHLHFGVYLNSKEGEMSVNPYWILKYLEEHKLTCEY